MENRNQSGGNGSSKDQDTSLLLKSFGSVGILVYFLFHLQQRFCFPLKLFKCLKFLMVPRGGGTIYEFPDTACVPGQCFQILAC